MAVVVRMSRHGGKNQPFYRVVVADSSKPRDGRFLKSIGYYNPRTEPPQLKLDLKEIEDWQARGAKCSPAVQGLIRQLKRGQGEDSSKS